MSQIKNLGAFTSAAVSQLLSFLGAQLSSFAAGVTTGVIPANVLTGAMQVFLNSAATTPGNQTTRTAAQLYADLAAQLGIPLSDPALAGGITYTLTITQTGAGTFTLVGGTGVTITGSGAIATLATSTFVVNLQPTTATFTLLATNTAGAAGPTGATGPTGPTGATGPTGP